MAEPLRLFVSATRDLEPQRAVIGRALADLPVKVTIEIRRTPARGADYATIFDLIANCDRMYFLLGQDITAPAGTEWDIARELGVPIVRLRRSGPLTPAAQTFLHLAGEPWQIFRSDEDLARLVTLDVIDTLLHPQNRYGLTVTEMERLHAYREHFRPERVARGEPGGAEGGGVLLDDLRREPLTGVLVTPKTARQPSQKTR